MKHYAIYILFTGSLFLLNCKGEENDALKPNNHAEITEDSVQFETVDSNHLAEQPLANWAPLDSVMEKNNPAGLDFSTHQLFIDTTRDSRFYDEIANWKPSFSDTGGINYYVGEIESEFGKHEFDLKSFPRDWINVHKMNGEYVIYNPLNGIDSRYRLTNHSLNYYAIESDADTFYELEELTNNHLLMNMKTIVQKSESKTAKLSIAKTTIPYVYLFKCEYDTYTPTFLMTPLDKIKHFDLVVNFAPELVRSRVTFDRIDFDQIELE